MTSHDIVVRACVLMGWPKHDLVRLYATPRGASTESIREVSNWRKMDIVLSILDAEGILPEAVTPRT